MRSGTRRRLRGAALGVVAVALVAVAGCSSPQPGDTQDRAKGHEEAGSRSTGEKRTATGGSVGAPGSACPLPVTFDLAADWKPDPVESDTDGEFAALLVQGPVTLVCEIDAKPAGHIGFIRVWVGEEAGDDTRGALEAFVADGSQHRAEETYKETEAGEFAATEVMYVDNDKIHDTPKKQRAFAVATPKGVVVVDLGGLDSQEHEQMLPAYELARKTLRRS